MLAYLAELPHPFSTPVPPTPEQSRVLSTLTAPIADLKQRRQESFQWLLYHAQRLRPASLERINALEDAGLRRLYLRGADHAPDGLLLGTFTHIALYEYLAQTLGCKDSA